MITLIVERLGKRDTFERDLRSYRWCSLLFTSVRD